MFAVDASTWDRCDAECSPERGFHYSASKHSAGQPIVAGWSYQWICQLNWAPDSWTAPLDALRISPSMDGVGATVEQVKRLVDLLPDDREMSRSSSSTPATTASPSAMGWPTPGPRCWCASPRPGSSILTPRSAGHRRRRGRPPRHGPRFMLSDRLDLAHSR